MRNRSAEGVGGGAGGVKDEEEVKGGERELLWSEVEWVSLGYELHTSTLNLYWFYIQKLLLSLFAKDNAGFGPYLPLW